MHAAETEMEDNERKKITLQKHEQRLKQTWKEQEMAKYVISFTRTEVEESSKDLKKDIINFELMKHDVEEQKILFEKFKSEQQKRFGQQQKSTGKREKRFGRSQKRLDRRKRESGVPGEIPGGRLCQAEERIQPLSLLQKLLCETTVQH